MRYVKQYNDTTQRYVVRDTVTDTCCEYTKEGLLQEKDIRGVSSDEITVFSTLREYVDSVLVWESLCGNMSLPVEFPDGDDEHCYPIHDKAYLSTHTDIVVPEYVTHIKDRFCDRQAGTITLNGGVGVWSKEFELRPTTNYITVRKPFEDVYAEQVIVHSTSPVMPKQLFYGLKANAMVLDMPNLRVIGESAFQKCELPEFTIPETVTEIEGLGFAEFGTNTPIAVLQMTAENIEKLGTKAFESCCLEGDLHFTSIKALAYECFSNISGVSSIEIGGSVESIPQSCFKYASVDKVIIPSSVKVIQDGAFAGSHIKELTIADDVQIEGTPFFACAYLESLHLPPTLRVLVDGAFSDCASLRTVNTECIEELDLMAFSVSKGSEVCATLTELHLENLKKLLLAGKEIEDYADIAYHYMTVSADENEARSRMRPKKYTVGMAANASALSAVFAKTRCEDMMKFWGNKSLTVYLHESAIADIFRELGCRVVVV